MASFAYSTRSPLTDADPTAAVLPLILRSWLKDCYHRQLVQRQHSRAPPVRVTQHTHTHTLKKSLALVEGGGTLPRWHQWPILPSHTRSSSRRDLRDESTSTTSIRTSLPKPISREHWLVSHGKDDCRHHRGRYGRHGRHGRYHLHDHHEQWLVLCVQNHALILRSLIYQRCSISNAQPWWTI